MGKLSSGKLVPNAQKVGDQCHITGPHGDTWAPGSGGNSSERKAFAKDFAVVSRERNGS